MRDRYQKGTLTREGNRWILRYSERHGDGKITRPRVVVGTVEQYPTPKKARLRADAIMREVNDARTVITFAHLCDRYEREGLGHLKAYTRKNYGTIVRRLRAAFGSERVDWLASAPGRAKIGKWLTDLTTQDGKPVTASFRRSMAGHLGMVFNYAMAEDILPLQRNPIEVVRYHNLPDKTTPPRRHDVLTAEQYRALHASPMLQQMDKTLLSIMETTGMRGCEAIALKWADIDFAGALGWYDIDPADHGTNSETASKTPKIFIHRSAKGPHIDETPKTSRSKRTVAMPESLASVLHRWRAAMPSINGWVFGSPHDGNPYNAYSIQRRIKAVATELGFAYEGFGLHANRHTFRRNLADAGATEEQQMWALGHSQSSMTRKYGQDGFDKAAKLALVVNRLAQKTGTEEG